MSTAQKDIPTSEVLTAAADLLRDGIWVQSYGWAGADDSRQGLCLEGGIMAALGLEYDRTRSDGGLEALNECPAYKAVSEYLKAEKDHKGPLWSWNDRRDQTRAKVIRLLRTVARREKKKENASE